MHESCLQTHAHAASLEVRGNGMAILQVRDLDDRLYHELKRTAREHKRSVSQEVIHMIEQYLSDPRREGPNPVDSFLQLAGSWEDPRAASEIVRDIRGDRTTNRRFSDEDGLFD